MRDELKIFSTQELTVASKTLVGLSRVLGLNAEQMELVMRAAITLGTSAGIDLVTAIEDVTKALGGSSVVMDKYGIFVRDTDKAIAAFQLGFTDTLRKGTQGLTSQQLAMAGLQAVVIQLDPLNKAFAEYQNSLPGKIQAANSRIADQTVILGSNFADLTLATRELQLSLLEFFNEISEAPAINLLIDLLEKFTKKVDDARDAIDKLNKILNIKSAAEEFSKGIEDIPIFAPTAPGLLEQTLGIAGLPNQPILGGEEIGRIRFYTEEQLRLDKRNTEEMIKTYRDAVEEFRRLMTGVVTKILRPDGRPPLDEPARTPHVFGTQKKEGSTEEQTKRFGEGIVDAFRDFNIAQREALEKRNEDFEKANREYLRDLDDLATKLARKMDELARELEQEQADLELKFQMELDELETEETDKRVEAELEKNSQIEEATEDFYRKLRELTDEYYFDLRDAVADNDAVAIKKLERRFNLDKKKLQDNLDDKLDDIDEQEIKDLEKQNVDRRKLLLERHKQELEDLEEANQRKREEAQRDYEEARDDLELALEREREDIQLNYDLEISDLEQHLEDRKSELIFALAKEKDLTEDQVADIIDIYTEFYADDLELLEEWLLLRQQLIGELGPDLGGAFITGFSPSGDLAVGTGFSGNTRFFLTLQSDGTITDSMMAQIVAELSAIIADIIVSASGGGGGGGGGIPPVPE
jgi:hypothetical protein